MTSFVELDRPDVVAAAERYIGQPRPLFTKLPVAYRVVPLPVRTRILRLMASRRQHVSGFPAWPVEDSLDRGHSSRGYDGRRAAVLVTHDIDSHPELATIPWVRAMEREIGIVASYGFVPRVSWPTEDLARSLVAEGCEVYVHDIAHDGRLPYLGPTGIRAAFDEVFARSPWAADLMRTFRSGQLLASAELLDAVAEYFAIDMSIPDTERDGPYGAFAGCATVFPFRFHGLLEMPVTMPQEVFVRQVYGLSADEALATWRAKLSYIREIGGVASLNFHPVWMERDPGLRAVVGILLREIALDRDLLVTTPSALARIIGGT